MRKKKYYSSVPNGKVIVSQSVIKLIGSNYLAWRVQINALLVGYNWMGFVDGFDRIN